MIIFNAWKVLELTCSRQSYLSEVEPIPMQRSRVRPIPKSCFNDRISRDLWSIEKVRVIKLPSLTCYSSTVVLFGIGKDP